ncbi:MAG: histidine triad nucleotide-binding protein [Rhodospirillales bacterium 12-54-5]|nr:MAG: histidine triad nucleotide-binding protein [Rhodospirillales bacterium 12-54-5]
MNYDSTNIFAKILRGEIPCNKVYDDAFALAFHDIAPAAPVHVLVLPKGAYRSYEDFMLRAGEVEILGFFKAVRSITEQLGVVGAFRLITNNGERAGQTVHHFHVHILAGEQFHALLP